METDSSNKNLRSFLFTILVAGSLLLNNYQEQYQYGSIDLFSIPTDATVECLVGPEQSHFEIGKILSSFEVPGISSPRQVANIPYPHKTSLAHHSLHIKVIVPTTSFASMGIPQLSPVISVLKKGQPVYSSQDDEPFPVSC